MVPQFVIDTRTRLTVGFLALGLGTALAYRTPAERYELSIYAGTPDAFWGLVVASLAIATIVTFSSDSGRFQRLAMALGGLSMTTIVSIPLIRSYYFLNEGDSLTHLGLTFDINNGIVSLTDFRYPVVHTLASVTRDITGLNLRLSLLLYVPIFAVSFFIFVPLCVRILTDHDNTVRVGVFTGLLLLPINNLASHFLVHPSSHAVMFIPAVLFAFFLYYTHSPWRSVPLFIVLTGALVLLHPQQAANFLLFVGGIGLAQLGHRYLKHGSMRNGTRQTIIPVVISSGLFWLWVNNLERVESAVRHVVVSAFASTIVAPETMSRASSLSQIGGSVETLFVKIFLVPLIFCVLAGMLMLYAVLDELEPPRWATIQRVFPFESGNHHILLVYIMFGFSGVTGIFIIYLGIGISGQYFRHLAFMMALVTVIGAIAFAEIVSVLQSATSHLRGAGPTIVVIFVFLLASIPMVYSSPYIYQDSDHVTEAQVQGFDTTFRYQDKSNDWLYVRSEPDRYLDGLRGESNDEPLSGVVLREVPNHFDGRRLPALRDKSFYFSVTETERSRQAKLYRGINYNASDFRYLRRDEQIHSIYSTGDYSLYYVRGSAS
jgi:hypothetical protein